MRQGRAQAIAGGLIAVGAAVALATLYAGRTKTRAPRRIYDYSLRSGFRRPAAEMRGAARALRPPSAVSASQASAAQA